MYTFSRMQMSEDTLKNKPALRGALGKFPAPAVKDGALSMLALYGDVQSSGASAAVDLHSPDFGWWPDEPQQQPGEEPGMVQEASEDSGELVLAGRAPAEAVVDFAQTLVPTTKVIQVRTWKTSETCYPYPSARFMCLHRYCLAYMQNLLAEVRQAAVSVCSINSRLQSAQGPAPPRPTSSSLLEQPMAAYVNKSVAWPDAAVQTKATPVTVVPPLVKRASFQQPSSLAWPAPPSLLTGSLDGIQVASKDLASKSMAMVNSTFKEAASLTATTISTVSCRPHPPARSY